MLIPENPDPAFAAELQALRRMNDDELLSRWQENDRLPGGGLHDGAEQHLRQEAFRYVAAERFGVGFGSDEPEAEPSATRSTDEPTHDHLSASDPAQLELF